MEKIIAINAGSSSLKFQLFEAESEQLLAKALVERIGLANSVLTFEYGEEEITKEFPESINTHNLAVELLFEQLEASQLVDDFNEITGVAHRVASGGEVFPETVVITDEVIQKIDDLSDLAPLHNPPQVEVMRAFREMLPETFMVAVFDTSFHSTIPAKNYIYSIPYEYYEAYDIRKYGFHGTSHSYVARRAAELLEEPIEDLKIITCHLGNGASIAAIDGGKSVDTSMGFTPLEGLTMGTRSGSLDPAIVPYLMEQLDKEAAEVIDIFNNKSGLLGISGISSDMRDIEEAADEGHERAQLALDIFIDRVQKYIGSYTATMNGVDAIVFTAGIGENSITTREKIISGLSWFGAKLDEEKNNTRDEAIVSTDEAKVKVLNIPTNEELEMAREVKRMSNQASVN